MKHPGRRIAKLWYKDVFNLSDAIDWVWATENTKPNPEAMRLGKSDSVQLERIKLELEVWRSKRKSSWIETFWSSKWDQNKRIDGTFFQHPDDPSLPIEDETSQMFSFLLASIPAEVFLWARYNKKIWSRSYEKRFMRNRDLMDVGVEYIVEDLLRIESSAHYWSEKLGPQNWEDIPLPPWATNAILFGHGPRTRPISAKQVHQLIPWMEKWKDLGERSKKISETNGEYNPAEIIDG
jgi:hypothetical protein